MTSFFLVHQDNHVIAFLTFKMLFLKGWIGKKIFLMTVLLHVTYALHISKKAFYYIIFL